jgi:hypothetical protein
MIGRWISLPQFSASCIPLEGDRKVKTSFVWPAHSSAVSWFKLMAFFLLGRVFGRLKFIWRRLSLFGRKP